MGKHGWGIIGFGEVGYTFARYLAQQTGERVAVVDPLLHENPLPPHIGRRLEQVQVEALSDIRQLAVRCDCVLSVVTTRVAGEVARQAGAVWQQGLFIDLNSSPPGTKRQASAHFPNEAYVDGAILGAIAIEGAKSPIALAGGRAAEAAALLQSVGMRTSVTDIEVGAASALKLCRSIFMKGLEALLVETLLAAGEFAITEPVLATIQNSIEGYGLRPLVHMLVTSHALHCVRRAHEMEGVVAMLEDMNLPGKMSAAAALTLAESGQAGLPQHAGGVAPDDFGEVIDYLRQYYRLTTSDIVGEGSDSRGFDK
jgi:3-hydroxyisobutyrate dehydrogenase-like beta-hydroxyacid dehydrogenase